MEKKVKGVQGLLVPCKDCEARFLVRGLNGKLRIGLAEKTILPAIAHAFTTVEMKKEDKKLKDADLKRACMANNALILKTAYWFVYLHT